MDIGTIITLILLAIGLVFIYLVVDYTTKPSVDENIIGVREPCLAFVNTVKQNRKRFKMDYSESFTSYKSDREVYTSYCITFKDLLLNLEWKINIDLTKYRLIDIDMHTNTQECLYFYGFPDWLNDVEKKYIFLELKKFYDSLKKRKYRRRQILDDRYFRDLNKAQDKVRQEYIKHYCK